tara:strand:- start:9575 stop:10354 length:780 start_codon:yes stop_codon:yes gene_type:complete
MDTKSNTKAGIFVVIGLSLFVVMLFAISGNSSFFNATYRLYVKMPEVRGIATGSVVQLVGVPVGNVEEITFNQKGDLVMVLLIESDYQERITEGSIAGLRTQGALGDKFVYIMPGDYGAPPLKDGDYITTEEGSDLFSALSEKGDQVEYLFEMLRDARDLIREIKGDGEIKDAIISLKQAAANLNQFTSDLNGNGSGKELRNTIERLNQIMAKIDNGNGSLGALINDPSLYKKLNDFLGGKDVSPIKSAIRDSIQEIEQ